MKWAVVGLTLLGIIAAACAALLVNVVRAGGTHTVRAGTGDSEVQVLLAAHPLQEMTVVEADSVVTKTLPRSQAPERFISDPVQVVGRILVLPMVEGQTFTPQCFVNEEKSAHLAALLPKGKRAVGISVSDYGGLTGVLYPGCAVDVLVSMKTDDDGKQKSSSKLLLQNIPVWGIEDETIVSSQGDLGASPESGRSANTRRVTLLVDTKQAKLLEIGMQEGALSLALRNPLDTALEIPDVDLTPAAAAPLQPPVVAAGASAKPAPEWQMRVIHGDAIEMKSFPVTAVNVAQADPAKPGTAIAQPSIEK